MNNPKDFVIENGVLVRYTGRSKNIEIPEGVTEIGPEAFKKQSIETVTLPNGLKKIGDEAFSQCSNLSKINLPQSVVVLGKSVFFQCSNLQAIDLPSGIMSIPFFSFCGCSRLETIQLHSGVLRIEDYAFSSCKSLKEITLPNSLENIGAYAFEQCCNLSEIIIPSSVKTIGEDAFTVFNSWLSCLKRIIVDPENPSFVDIDGILYNKDQTVLICCPAKKETEILKIPDSVTRILPDAFKGCSCVKKICLPEKIKKIDREAFSYCTGMNMITFPDSLSSIGYHAFSSCKNLHNIIIPNSVEQIDDYAFQNCTSLEEIRLPGGITSIGQNVFSGCRKLRKIECDSNCSPLLKKNTFGEASYSLKDPFPSLLYKAAPSFFDLLDDGALKQYILTPTGWNNLTPEVKFYLFCKFRSKAYNSIFTKLFCQKDVDVFGKKLEESLSSQPTAEYCSAAGDYLLLFSKQISDQTFQTIYDLLLRANADRKILKALEKDLNTKSRLSGAKSEEDMRDPREKAILRLWNGDEEHNSYHKLQKKGVPYADGSGICSAEALVCMICAYTAQIPKSRKGIAISDYKTGHFSLDMIPEVMKFVAFLDRDALSACLRDLVFDKNKKDALAFFGIIATEADTAKLLSEMNRWKDWYGYGVSGRQNILIARGALMHNNTKAAAMHFDKLGQLEEYAKLRGMSADDLRDRIMSDVGLDENRGKQYDLGNQVVTVRLQKDLSFLFELPDGKTAKSLPKKGADEAKFAAAKADFDEMRKNVKKILKNRADRLLEDFLGYKTRDAAGWQISYLRNPLLREAASQIVWAQGKKTFTVTEKDVINCYEQSYTITNEPIKVAHPMEMTTEDITAWQKYFTKYGMKQPFAQVWEPVHTADEIKPNRYKGCMIPYYRFTGQAKHGITVEDYDFHNDIEIDLKGIDGCIERIDWERHEIKPEHRFEIKFFTFKKYTRQVNHLVAYFDRVTVWDRVRKDDVTVAELLPGFTLAQITEFIAAAQEAKAANVLALLLDYKNTNFADFDPMEEFTLEW